MPQVPSETLPDELQLALAHTPRDRASALRIFFELDQRLGRIVGATNEPMLGQMRLRWWRDTLGDAAADRPEGDVTLDGISRHWVGHEELLIMLIDAWELMLGETWDANAAMQFARGRAAGFAVLGESDAVQAAGVLWALVDAGLHVSDEGERSMMLDLARTQNNAVRLPKPARGLAILRSLAQRSLKRGGRPLMEGRGAGLTALRASFFGR